MALKGTLSTIRWWGSWGCLLHWNLCLLTYLHETLAEHSVLSFKFLKKYVGRNQKGYLVKCQIIEQLITMRQNNNSHICLLLFLIKHLRSKVFAETIKWLECTYEIGLIIANGQSYGLNISLLSGPTSKMLYSNYTLRLLVLLSTIAKLSSLLPHSISSLPLFIL